MASVMELVSRSCRLIHPAKNGSVEGKREKKRESALRKLGRRKDVYAVKKFFAALNDPSPYILCVAANSLISIYKKQIFGTMHARSGMNQKRVWDAHVVPALARKLGDPNEKKIMRFYSAVALGWMGDHRAVPMLIESFGSYNHYWRQSAAWALGMVPDFRATDALFEKTLNARHVCVRTRARAALVANILNIGARFFLNPVLSLLTFGTARKLVANPHDYHSGDIRCLPEPDCEGLSVCPKPVPRPKFGTPPNE